MWCPPFRRRLLYSDLQEAREEERRREGRGEEQRVDKLGNYSSITGFATIRQVHFPGIVTRFTKVVFFWAVRAIIIFQYFSVYPVKAILAVAEEQLVSSDFFI
jgi:hypothetical protein